MVSLPQQSFCFTKQPMGGLNLTLAPQASQVLDNGLESLNYM